MRLYSRLFVCLTCIVSMAATPAPPPATVSSDNALVGWAAGPAVSAERETEHTMMGVPSAANAMEIERNISSVPHRATTDADYATALYVKARLERDGFTTRIKEYQVEFTGPLQQSLELVAPQQIAFDLLEGTPGAPYQVGNDGRTAVSRGVG